MRPNIILIMADDLGYETITANGGTSYQTPNIDKMATEGMRFEHCYAQPLCTPSRVKLMTGMSNIRNYVRFGLLDTSQTTFGHIFQKAGYETCVIGKWQLGKDSLSPAKAGFDEHCLWQVTKGRVDSTGRDTRFSQPVLEVNGIVKEFDGEIDFGPKIVSDYGMDFIERSVSTDKPFLLYYPMILTHCPFSVTPDSKDWLTNDSSTMTYKGQPEYFGDMMAYTDKIIGKINLKLDELGISDNTIILFTGDNGTDTPIVSEMNGMKIAGAKGQSTDAGTRVPLIVKWPGKIQAGDVNNNLVDLSDFLPTICQASNIIVPDSLDLDGTSFYEQLINENPKPRDWIYNWYSRSGKAEEAKVFARTQQYKLYDSGEYFDITNDHLEQNPLLKKDLTEKAKIAYEMLNDVITSYSFRRLELIPN
jgi:arylsulfatase A